MQADEKGRFTEQALFYKPSIREALLDIQRLGFISLSHTSIPRILGNPTYSVTLQLLKPRKVIESQQYHAVNLTINLNLMNYAKRTLNLMNVQWQNCVVGMEILARAQSTLPVTLERH